MAVEERKKATPVSDLGKEALRVKGFWRSYKWLILRRFSQLGILALFLIGPWFGIWIVKGNLASSLTLDVLPLTDPFVLLQTLAAGYLPEMTAVTGALIVLAFYMIIGGRAYCSWVCPINIVTDAAQWLRNKLNIKSELKLSRANRYWFLGAVLGVSAATGMLAWEFINPVSMVQRALIFGMGLAWAVIVMIFLLDAFISRRAWCGHLCPVGAFYSLLGKTSLFRVNAGAGSLRSLHGVFRRLPRTEGDYPGIEEKRATDQHHQGHQLHQLRSLHRYLQHRRFPLRPAFP